MQRIKPPRKPRGEDPTVTIANQDMQIRNLIERCIVLSADNLKMEQDRDRLIRELDIHRDAGERLMDKLSQMEKAHVRLSGWQDCAREILGARDVMTSSLP